MKLILVFLLVLFIHSLTYAQIMNIEADKNAKAYASEEIIINSSAGNVFKKVAEINNWPSWQSEVTFSSLDGELNEGAVFKWKASGLNFSSRIHTLIPNKAIGWTGKTWWIKAVHNWSFEETASGTKVHVEESLHGFGSGMMKKSLGEGMKKNLGELKAVCE
jgi:hypothetical protein